MSQLCLRRFAALVLPLLALLAPALTVGQDSAEGPPTFLLDISREFVATGIEQSIDRTDPVNESLSKVRITGTGHTVAKVGVELVPNDDMAVIDLVTAGTTLASTVGVRGPVQIYTDSTIPFQIRQRVFLRPEGIISGCPQARADGDTVLTGITTDFHCLLDRTLKKIACKQFYKTKDKAQASSMRSIEAKLNESSQAEAAPKLQEADQALKKNLADLRTQGVVLGFLRFATSSDMVFVRANLAVPGQASIAPPPALTTRSYLALRLHESAVDEAAKAKLAGKTFTGVDLEREAKKLGQLEAPMPKDDKDFSITFQQIKPLAVTFADQKMRATLRLAEFTSGDDEYAGMDLTMLYKFVSDGAKIVAVRQGPIEAFPPNFQPGQKLSGRQQAMRTILQKRFGKFFKEEMPLQDMELTGDMKKAGPLVATRAEAANGWLLLTWRKGTTLPVE